MSESEQVSVRNPEVQLNRPSSSHTKVQCDHCKAIMPKTNLIMHMKTHLPSNRTCTEPNCSRSFANESLMQNHIKWEHRMVACGMCNKFVVAKGLKFHIRSVHLNMQMRSCDVCGQEFKRLDAYKRHFKNAHTPTEKVQCDICKVFVKNRTVLYAHRRTVHSGCDPISCNLCGHQSPNLKAAKSHLKFHQDKQEMRSMCSICGQRFINNVQLMRHQIVHKQLRYAIDCPHCDSTFISETGRRVRNLKLSMNEMHIVLI